jgi:hypothetical protein
MTSTQHRPSVEAPNPDKTTPECGALSQRNARLPALCSTFEVTVNRSENVELGNAGAPHNRDLTAVTQKHCSCFLAPNAGRLCVV